jgi:hypothetical protein
VAGRTPRSGSSVHWRVHWRGHSTSRLSQLNASSSCVSTLTPVESVEQLGEPHGGHLIHINVRANQTLLKARACANHHSSAAAASAALVVRCVWASCGGGAVARARYLRRGPCLLESAGAARGSSRPPPNRTRRLRRRDGLADANARRLSVYLLLYLLMIAIEGEGNCKGVSQVFRAPRASQGSVRHATFAKK